MSETNFTWTFGKLRLAAASGQLMRENDGALVIMAGEPLADDSARIGTIDMRVKAKRGEAWRTEDAEQEAIARFIVDAVNEKIARSHTGDAL